MFSDPMPLTHGKTIGHQFAVCVRDWKTARQLGHKGCCVEAYVFDRLAIQTWERTWKHWLASKRSSFDSMASPGTPKRVFHDTEFVFCVACAAHDAHNALKWALWFRFDDKQLTRDSWVSVASLRNSMDLLRKFAGEWVSTHLSYADPWSSAERDLWTTIWTSLGLEPDLVDNLAETYQVKFTEGRLFVTRKQEGNPALISELCSVLFAVWRFVLFTESRWMTVGTSSRTIVASQLLGMGSLVEMIFAQKNVTCSYLKGYARLEGDVVKFMAEAALVSRVPDAALQMVVEDAQALRQYNELWAACSEELSWLCELSDGVWQAIAPVAGWDDWATFKSECLHAAHVAYHFCSEARSVACEPAPLLFGHGGHTPERRRAP